MGAPVQSVLSVSRCWLTGFKSGLQFPCPLFIYSPRLFFSTVVRDACFYFFAVGDMPFGIYGAYRGARFAYGRFRRPAVFRGRGAYAISRRSSYTRQRRGIFSLSRAVLKGRGSYFTRWVGRRVDSLTSGVRSFVNAHGEALRNAFMVGGVAGLTAVVAVTQPELLPLVPILVSMLVEMGYLTSAQAAKGKQIGTTSANVYKAKTRPPAKAASSAPAKRPYHYYKKKY